jgi:hypothetical protein
VLPVFDFEDMDDQYIIVDRKQGPDISVDPERIERVMRV